MICAVVVTYNRVELLKKCLQSIDNQTLNVDKMIIVDNCSTDGTAEFLAAKKEIIVINPEKNVGGAGGFYLGLKKAYDENSDYIWLMDDDCCPNDNALQELVNAGKLVGDYSFLASKVVGENGEPMNVPSVSKRTTDNGYPYWYKFLNQGIVEISDATFVSLLIPCKSLEISGLPYPDFFIWGDDYEYTTRLTRYVGKAYFVGKSEVVHLRKGAKAIDFLKNDDPWVNSMAHYFYRNMLINLSEYGDWTSVLKFLILNCFKAILRGKIKGPMQGLTEWIIGNYDRKKFKNRFKI